LRAPFAYAGTGGALVRRLKFAGDFGAGRKVGPALAAAAADALRGPWRRAVLVPVPLHGRKLRQRGFDQARVLAEEVRRRTGLPILAGVLRRTRETLPQGDPRVTARDRNVAGAFVVSRPPCIRGRRIVLVDDVFTSGATARACAGALHAAGAAEVAFLAACRA
jgi:ComF family protein